VDEATADPGAADPGRENADHAGQGTADPDIEYRGLVAQTWDLLRGDTSGWEDRPFFRQVIEASGQPALDVGCGTGRLLLDYLAGGIDVDGVDISAEMLALCQDKAVALGLRPRLYQQAMEALDLPRRYRTIIVPSSSFQLLLDAAAAREAMGRFFAHLQPGGTLAMPFIAFGPEDEAGTEFVREQTRADGAIVRKHARYRYHPVSQLESTDELFEVLVDGVVVESERSVRSPATRGYTVEQAVELYREAGFEVEQVVSEFTDRPYEAGDDIFTIVGRRPARP
jgi:ubiquinone/menaquinone biosynthesis C-methylase UbiE